MGAMLGLTVSRADGFLPWMLMSVASLFGRGLVVLNNVGLLGPLLTGVACVYVGHLLSRPGSR